MSDFTSFFRLRYRGEKGGKHVSMRIKRILVSLVVSCTMLCLLTFPKLKAASVTTELQFSGLTASCKGTIVGSGSIEATLELWRGSTKLESWSDSGTGYLQISETYSVSHGVSYTLKLTGTIGGVAFPESSVTKVCP